MKRFLPPDYADGISAPRASITGRPLPTPRAVSAHVHKVSLGLSNFLPFDRYKLREMCPLG